MITEIVERDWTTKYGYRCIIIGKSNGYRKGFIGVNNHSTYFGKKITDKIEEFDNTIFRDCIYSYGGDGIFFAGIIDKKEFGSLEELWWLGFDFEDYEYSPDFSLTNNPEDDDPNEHYPVLYHMDCKKECERLCGELYKVDRKLQRCQKLQKLLNSN